MTTLSLFEAAASDADRLALVSAEGSITYGELGTRVELARKWLAAQGIAPGRPEPVALVMHNSVEAIELFWAAFALGRPLLVLHPRQRSEVRAALVARTGAVEIDAASFGARTPSRSGPLLAPEPSPATRLIVPTSGTQGHPKLVMLSERALVASASASWQNLGVVDDERWLACLPLAHVGGLSILTRCLLARRTVVLFDGESGLLARIEALGRALEEQRVTLVSLVPTVLDALLAHGFRPPETLRAVLLGGAAASPSLLERARLAGLPLLTSYGMTEAASQATTRSYGERYAPLELHGGLVASGRPLSGMKLRIGKDDEIQLAGPMLFDGYWGEPPARADSGWFRTGDRGVIRENGELVVLGRCDDLIVTGGENVDPVAVESMLSRLPGLRGACVFGVDDPRWGQIVAAALAFAPGHEPSSSEIAVFCNETLPSHERPRLVALFPDLPLNPTGKVDRRQLKEIATPLLVRLGDPVFTPPR